MNTKLLILIAVVSATSGLTVLNQAQAVPETAESSGSSEADSASIEEIVVTAQRQTETLQKSPLSIAVVDGEKLQREGITQPQDLNELVPGFQLSLAGTTAQPYVRGVGNADNTGFAVSGIAFNVDGVYVAQPVAYGSSLFDIDRVEVLRGPQGTLYGRNASGGAVNVITRAPVYETSGYVQAEYGNYDQTRVAGGFNTPLIDNEMALRAAFQYQSRNGYFHDGTSDQDSLQGRIRLRLDPIPSLSLNVNLEASRDRGEGPGYALDLGPRYFLPFPRDGSLGPNSVGYVNAENVSLRPSQYQTNYNASAELNWKVADSLTFTLLPAYRDVKVNLVNYNGFLYDVTLNDWKETTVESRLVYDTDKLKLVGGLYYFDQHQSLDFSVDNFPIELIATVPHLTTQSYAGFTQGTFSVTDSLRLTAGVRYTHEKQVLGLSQNEYLPPLAGTIPYEGQASKGATDFKVGAEYDLTPQNLVFASLATGFKAGGVFPSPTGPFGGNTYAPERLKAYTLGSRNRFSSNRLQLNGEAFYWRYTDKQETFTSTDGLGLVDNVTKNAPLAIIYGADLDALGRITPRDTLRATVEYLHATYSSFVYNSISPVSGCPVSPAGAQFAIDCDGKQLARSPTWSGTAGYDRILSLGIPGTFTASADMTFSSARWLAVYYTEAVHAPAYVKGDAYVTYDTPGGRLALTAYVRNLSNAVIATGAYSSLRPDIYWLPLDAPRTYGLQAKYSF